MKFSDMISNRSKTGIGFPPIRHSPLLLQSFLPLVVPQPPLLNELPKNKSASVQWSALAHAKIKEMENVVAKATAVKKALRAIMQCGCTKLGDCARGFVQSPRRTNNLRLPLPTGPIAGLKNIKPASAESLDVAGGNQDGRRRKRRWAAHDDLDFYLYFSA